MCSMQSNKSTAYHLKAKVSDTSANCHLEKSHIGKKHPCSGLSPAVTSQPRNKSISGTAYLSESFLVWEDVCSITPKVHLNNPHYGDIQYLQTVNRASGQTHTGRMMDCTNHSTRRHRCPPNQFRLKYNYIGNEFLLQICSEWTLDCTQHCFTVQQQEKKYHYL